MGRMKGVRKSIQPGQARRPVEGIRIGGYVFPPEIVMVALMSLLYLLLLIGGVYEHGFDALVLMATAFAVLVLLAYSVRAGLKSMRLYAGLIDAYILLSLVPLLRGLAALAGYDLAKAPGLSSLAGTGVLSLVTAIVLIPALLYFKKDRPSSIYLQKGDQAEGLKLGLPALVACVALSAIVAYKFYDAGSLAFSSMLPAAGALIVFSITSAAADELWFRGLLLSRLLPILDTASAFIMQAIVSAAFGAILVYVLGSSLPYAFAAFAVLSVLGALWAWATLKTNSLLPAVLTHAGVNLILMLPLFAPFFK